MIITWATGRPSGRARTKWRRSLYLKPPISFDFWEYGCGYWSEMHTFAVQIHLCVLKRCVHYCICLCIVFILLYNRRAYFLQRNCAFLFCFWWTFFFLCQAVHYLNLLAWDHFDFKTAEQLLIIDVRYWYGYEESTSIQAECINIPGCIPVQYEQLYSECIAIPTLDNFPVL